MKKILYTIAAAGTLLGFATTGFAHFTSPGILTLAPSSRLWFEGTSTVKAFTCSATKIDATVNANSTGAPESLVKSARLSVAVASLDCKNGTMNDHMRKALKAKENPQITWQMKSYRVEGTTVVMDGLLSIAGKENPLELTATGTAENGTIKIKGSKQFRMTEFGVKPPKLMLGAMKVNDAVTVKFDFVLNP